MQTPLRPWPLRRLPVSLLLAANILLCASASAQAVAAGGGWWPEARDKLVHVYNSGRNDLFVSGYAYHGRDTYTPQRIDELNEKIWGGGIGKSVRNSRGDEESVYFMGISDSHRKPQFMAGYAYQWMWPLGNSSLEVGAGFTALLISRVDYFNSFPFPAALPVASIGTPSAKLELSYVPRLSSNKGNGDVLIAVLRFRLK